MSAARKRERPVPVDLAEPEDLRIEMRVKNNILWHAIHDRYKSISALCRSHPDLEKKQTIIGCLLRFKISPFRGVGEKGKKRQVFPDYRPVCRTLEQVLEVPAEDLFPQHLYKAAVGGTTERVLEVSSFTALSATARHNLLLLPAPNQDAAAIEMDRELLRERLKDLLGLLSFREREILKLRFGLDGDREHTLKEVSEIFKVKGERVRQIQAKAIRRLGLPPRAKQLVGFLD